MSKNFGAIVSVFALVVGVVLGVWWLFWQLWCWVMPQLWIGGPENVITPNFWLFCGAWFLLGVFGRAITGARNRE